MADDISAEVLRKLTLNAQDWAYYYQAELERQDTREQVSVALERVFYDILNTITEELEDALSNSIEFSRSELRYPLLLAFSKPEIIKVTDQGTIYFNAEEVAGGWNDFDDGVSYARSVIGISEKSTPEQRARFWKNIVWPSYGNGGNDLWSDTIKLRQEGGWGNGLAPYWLILEHGNVGSLAYPQQSPTNFLMKAEKKAQGILNAALVEVRKEIENVVVNSAEAFLFNPDVYEQFDILEDFYAKGKQYYVYITSTRQVGVALPETYEQLKREYFG